MSLIGDALKKAHLEAVRQDGTSSSLVHTPGVAQYRRNQSGGKKSWTTVLVVSNVILALVIATVIVWGVTRGDTPATASVASSDRASTPAPEAELETAMASPAVTTSNEPPPAASPTVSSANEAPATAAVETAATPLAVKSAETPRQVPAVADPVAVAAPPPAEAPARVRSRNGYVDGQTYMRSIPVPGGSELMLNGMSVAGGKGVALINGRMVREGDRVGPFQVGRIADRRVELGYDGITIYLKLP